MIAEADILPGLLHRVQTESRLLWRTGLVFSALFVLFFLLSLFDERQLLGINVWIKPIKFAISIAVFSLTIAWLLVYASMGKRLKMRLSWTIMAAMFTEIIIIAGQAARGQMSHFNIRTPFDGILFSVMGSIITLNTLVVAYLAVRFWRQSSIPGMSSAFLWSIRLGLSIFVLASLEGFVMVSHMSHTIKAADGGPGLPFVNWSTAAGDLRVAHFIGMHALQVLPVVTLILLKNKPNLSNRTVFVFGFAYLAISVLLFVQALRGIPLLGA